MCPHTGGFAPCRSELQGCHLGHFVGVEGREAPGEGKPIWIWGSCPWRGGLWGWLILGCGLSEYCRVLSSIPGLHPLHASSTPHPSVTPRYVSLRCQVSPGGQKRPWLRTLGEGLLEDSGTVTELQLEVLLVPGCGTLSNCTSPSSCVFLGTVGTTRILSACRQSFRV